MPRTSHDRNQLLTQLEAAKNHFDSSHVARLNKLLIQLSNL